MVTSVIFVFLLLYKNVFSVEQCLSPNNVFFLLSLAVFLLVIYTWDFLFSFLLIRNIEIKSLIGPRGLLKIIFF